MNFNTVVDERVNDAENMYQVDSRAWTCNVSHDTRPTTTLKRPSPGDL